MEDGFEDNIERLITGAGDRPGPHHPRPGRPRRPPLSDRHGRARLAGREGNQGGRARDRRLTGGLASHWQAKRSLGHLLPGVPHRASP
jgi:hypothetical protein